MLKAIDTTNIEAFFVFYCSSNIETSLAFIVSRLHHSCATVVCVESIDVQLVLFFCISSHIRKSHFRSYWRGWILMRKNRTSNESQSITAGNDNPTYKITKLEGEKRKTEKYRYCYSMRFSCDFVLCSMN